MKLSHFDLIQAILGSLKAQGMQAIYAYQMNAVCKFSSEMMQEIERPFRPATPGMGLELWRICDDIGLSSKAMACRMFAVWTEDPKAYPLNGDDFGRCVRFLDAVSETDVSRMSIVSPQWAALVDKWDVLTKLYREKKIEELTARIRELAE